MASDTATTYWQNKNVLITGVAGLIGSNLASYLLAQGASVDGVDNFITGLKQNLNHLLEQDAFQFTFADVTKPVSDWLPRSEYDVIFHFASPASPPQYQRYPVETYQVNAFATHNLLMHLHTTSPTTRFIFASTSEVYGDPLVHPQTESYYGNVNPNGVRSCYDEAKRFAETISGVFHRDFGLDTRLVRIFNTYGPGNNPADGRVIPNFIMQALQNKPITIYGDGTQTRSYCYVGDLVEGITTVAAHPEAAGQTFNLGNPDEMTILETAEVIVDLTNSSSEIIPNWRELPQNDPLQRQPDITKAMTKLGWQPTTGFKDGLQSVIAFFKANLEQDK